MEVSRSLGRRRGSIKRAWAVYNRCVGDIGDGCHSEKGTCLLRKYQHNKISMILCISLIITGTENTIAPIARFSCCLFTWQTKHPQTRVCTNKNFLVTITPAMAGFRRIWLRLASSAGALICSMYSPRRCQNHRCRTCHRRFVSRRLDHPQLHCP